MLWTLELDSNYNDTNFLFESNKETFLFYFFISLFKALFMLYKKVYWKGFTQ